jgi:hypothetical protein
MCFPMKLCELGVMYMVAMFMVAIPVWYLKEGALVESHPTDKLAGVLLMCTSSQEGADRPRN